MFSFLKGNVLVITVTRILGMFSRSAAFPYFSLYVLALGGDPAKIGFISSLRPLAGFLIFPLAGFVADRTGRVRLIVVAGYLSASIYLLYVFAGNWVILAIGSFLLGMIVFQFPAQSALMADSLSPKQRGIGFATSSAVPGTVAVMAPYLAGYLIDSMGVETAARYLYALIVVTYSVSATIQMKFLEDTAERSRASIGFSNLKELVKESYRSVIVVFKWIPTSLRALALVIALCFTANAIAGPFWVVYATQAIDLPATEWGMLISVYSALRIALSIPAGAVIDRLGKTKTIVAALMVSIVPLLYFTHSRGFIDILAVLLMLSFTNAFLPPAVSAFMADVVPS